MTNPELPIRQELREELDRDIASRAPVEDSARALLRVSNLKMYFPVTKGLLKRKVGDVKAVDDVTFSVQHGETLGLVGESGSGKSTIGNCVLGNCKVTSGQIIYDGRDIAQISKAEMRALRKDLTTVTQDPFASLNPPHDGGGHHLGGRPGPQADLGKERGGGAGGADAHPGGG